MSSSSKTPSPALVAFLEAAKVEHKSLEDAIQKALPAALPIDFSYESLDRVEDYVLALDASGAGRYREQEDLLVRYVGSTLIARAGGHWEPPRKPADLGKVAVAGLPQLGKARFDPKHPLRTVRNDRLPGFLRDYVERHDIVLRRKQLEAAVANVKDERSELERQVQLLVGKPAVLDYSPASLDALEEALQRLESSAPARDTRRLLQKRAVLYLGTVFQKKLGRGTWAIETDPKDVDIGEFSSLDWAPARSVRAAATPGPLGALREELDEELQARRKKK